MSIFVRLVLKAATSASCITLAVIVNFTIKQKIKLKNFKKIIAITFLLIALNSYSQNIDCDSIYTYVETTPKYKNDLKDGSDLFVKEIIPIISDCVERNKEIISRLNIELTIDKNGKVIDVIFSKSKMTKNCEDDLREKILKMEGWTAGTFNNEAICCKVKIPISCLKWQ